MGPKLFTAIISILLVLSLAALVSATGAGGGGSGGGVSVDSTPPQITIVSPDSNIVVGESLQEYFLLSYSNKELEIGEPIGPSAQGFIDFIDDDNLKMLADDIWQVDGSKHKYEQLLLFDKPVMKVTYVEDDNDITSLFLKVTDNQLFTRYELYFLTKPESSVAGEFLPDFQNTKLTILGKEYTVSQAVRPAPEKTGSIELTLIDSSGSTIILRDDDVTDAQSTHELVIDNETIYGAEVIITGTDNDVDFSIESIGITMNSGNDYFVPEDGKLSDKVVSTGDQKEILLNGLFDMEYHGLTEEKTHDLKLQSPSSQKYEFVWYDGDGNQVIMPLAYMENGYDLSLGEESWNLSRTEQKRLILEESVPISKNDYFVVTGGNPENGTAKSYLFQYLGVDNINATEPKIMFKDVGDDSIEYFDLTDGKATISAGGFSFAVENASDATLDNFQIFVDLNTIAIPQEPIEYPYTELLYEGESKNFTLDGEEYEVNLLFTSEQKQAKFSINGEATALMNEGESATVSGIEITLKFVTYQDFAGGVHAASFKLQKNPITDHTGITEEKVPIVDLYGSQWSFDWNVETSATMGDQDYITLTQTTPNENDYDNVKPEDITLHITAQFKK